MADYSHTEEMNNTITQNLSGQLSDGDTAVSQNDENFLVDFSKDFMFYCLSLIIPTGLIFNTVSIVVFMSSKLRKRSASIYLACLGASDDVALLSVMFDYWLKSPHIGLDLVKSSKTLCVTVTHLSYASRMFSALLVTSFTIERFIGIVFPLKRATFNRLRHVRRVILTELFISFTATSFVYFTIDVVTLPYGRECDVIPAQHKLYVVFNSVVLAFGSIVVPILVICSLNSFILRKICTRRINLVCSKKQFSRRTRQGYNTATTLLAVSTAFVILNLPYCLSWFLLFFHHYKILPMADENAFYRLYAAKYFTSVLYYLNYSINFLLYNICARLFRTELVRLLCLPVNFYHLRMRSRRLRQSNSTQRTYLDSSSNNQEVCQKLFNSSPFQKARCMKPNSSML